ncbi:MAG: S41 family peptidase [Verrucomicrobiales bacterium]|nr:S41 family peptidase [Verrucomicrobiales bacterium]
MRARLRTILLLLFSFSAVHADDKAPVTIPVAKKADELNRVQPVTVQGTVENPTGYSLETLVDGLNQANLQEAFRLLSSEYIKREDLDYLSLNRAAMQGILERLDFGAMLLTEASRSAQNSPYPFLSARIDDQIAYIRFGKFNRDELSSFDSVITEFREEEKIKTLILDLRSPQAQAEFTIASEILSRFRPPNELLFKIRRPGNERPTLFPSKPNAVSWGREIVILVDKETGNVGEIIAAVLQRKNNSLVIGEKTKGLTVEYRDVPIGEDRILRYAIAEVILEDESSIFQKGITPDLPTPAELESKHEVFEKINQQTPLSKFLFQKERPRMNEAALVAGTDPELEYYLAKSNGRKTEWDEQLPEDRVLQKAVDILRTRDFLDSGKRRKRRL